MTNTVLEIKNLKAEVEGKEILKGIDLIINSGEIHALMGPNGAGKSTLGEVLIGHPNYKVTGGKIMVNGKDITNAPPEDRAKAGLFLAFQNPITVSGVKISSFLRMAYKNLYPEENMSLKDFFNMVKAVMKDVDMDESFISRYINDGFSGGERKRFEVLQMVILKPKIVILDEIDSGVDVDALELVSAEIKKIYSQNVGFLIITHYQRILKDIIPEFVHIMKDGKIVMNGDRTVSDRIEDEGYDWIKE